MVTLEGGSADMVGSSAGVVESVGVGCVITMTGGVATSIGDERVVGEGDDVSAGLEAGDVNAGDDGADDSIPVLAQAADVTTTVTAQTAAKQRRPLANVMTPRLLKVLTQ